jgi:2'-5' RNA ligase
MTSYHLWLMPSGRLYELLAETITTLSRTHRAPRFDPHVTLLGHLPGSEEEIITNTSHLAEQLKPFEVRLITPGFTEDYFRCLFLKIDQSRRLNEAHGLARAQFNREADPPYQPHLSLLYGRYPQSLKEQIAGDLRPELSGRFTVDRLDLIRAESEAPTDWMKLGSVPFGPAMLRNL